MNLCMASTGEEIKMTNNTLVILVKTYESNHNVSFVLPNIT